MSTIHARFEKGVFKPLDAIQLPENCEVEFEPRIVVPAMTPEALDRIYAVMSRKHHSGDTNVAERHNEHQP